MSEQKYVTGMLTAALFDLSWQMWYYHGLPKMVVTVNPADTSTSVYLAVDYGVGGMTARIANHRRYRNSSKHRFNIRTDLVDGWQLCSGPDGSITAGKQRIHDLAMAINNYRWELFRDCGEDKYLEAVAEARGGYMGTWEEVPQSSLNYRSDEFQTQALGRFYEEVCDGRTKHKETNRA